ncbi:hypothetical protein P8452_69919 [Trifolium repens]|nr:hypothetical protein P8452_69916 [Trifolium repens]WJX87764.1 hypothetical protein P8452_69919 [Trifolium repens]
MDPNNHFNTQNSSNTPNNYQNPNYYQNLNQFFDQHPPNFHPYGGAPEFSGFSTQIIIGGMTVANEVTPNSEDSTHKSRKNHTPAWNTAQNLVLISGWIKFGTNSVVGRNQKGETYWGKIADYCNEHCSFDPPRDVVVCRNHFNYMSKIINKWIGAYDSAKRLKGNGRQLTKKGKKKSKEVALEALDNEWSSFGQFNEKELERLDKISLTQQEANQLRKMELYLKLSSEEYLNDRNKEMLKKLEQ